MPAALAVRGAATTPAIAVDGASYVAVKGFSVPYAVKLTAGTADGYSVTKSSSTLIITAATLNVTVTDPTEEGSSPSPSRMRPT